MSKDYKRFLLLISGLYLLLAGYLFLTDSILFPADYLSWYYPFRGYAEFQNFGPFVVNQGYQDVPFFYHPFCRHLGEAASRGEVALWNPYVGAGLPNTGGHCMGFYFPLHWLTYALFSPLAAHHAELTVQYFLSALVTFSLFKRWSGSGNGATFGALAWTLGGWLGGYFQQPSAVWPLILLPVILLGFECLSDGERYGIPLISFGVALTLVEGHVQMVVVSALMVVAVLAFRRLQFKLLAFLAGVAGILLAAPHIWSLTELVLLTDRDSKSVEMITQSLLAPQEYLGLVFPNFVGAPDDGFVVGRSLSDILINGREHALYSGVVPLLLALFAVVRLKDKSTRALSFVVLGGLVLAGSPFLYGTLAKLVPSLTYVTPLRFLFAVSFCICYLSCLGWREFEVSPPTFGEKKILGGFLGLVILWAMTFVVPATMRSLSFQQWILALVEQHGIVKPPYFEEQFGPLILERIMEHFSISSNNIWWPLFLVIATVLLVQLGKKKEIVWTGLLLLTLCDLSTYFVVMNRPTPRAMYFPQVRELSLLREGRTLSDDFKTIPTRAIGRGRGAHPNLLLPYNIATIETYGSILPGDFRDVFKRINRPESLSHQLAAVTESAQVSPGLLDLLGVSIVYNHPSPGERLQGGANLDLGAERETALRAFLSTSWKQAADNSEIFEPDFDPRDGVLLEEPAPFPTSNDIFERVEATYYGYDVVRFQLEVPQTALLVLTDFYYPGWTVEVNGEEAEIQKAYGFLRAVVLPEGSSDVTFRFFPNGWRWFWLLAFLGLALTGGLLIWSRRLTSAGKFAEVRD